MTTACMVLLLLGSAGDGPVNAPRTLGLALVMLVSLGLQYLNNPVVVARRRQHRRTAGRMVKAQD